MLVRNANLLYEVSKDEEKRRFITCKIVVVVGSNDRKSAAVCASLQDMKIEFFAEKFPGVDATKLFFPRH
jgi:uncharacterized membrane protein YheB (UPF0754 family)